MSKSNSVRFFALLLFVVFSSAVLVTADLGVLAQNSNSSTTGDTMQTDNANMNMGRRGTRRRKHRRHYRPAASSAATADTGQPTADASAASNMGGEQTDLSGTYTGHLSMTGGHEMNGQATLTITSNQFTLASEGMTHNGRIYAVTTRGYTGASLYFTDLSDPATSTPVVASVRARKTGDRLNLTPAPGVTTRLTFTTGGSAGGGGHRGRRGHRRGGGAATDMTPVTPAEPATSATPTEESATPATPATPARGRRGRRGRRSGNMNMNNNMGDNMNMNHNMNSNTPPR
ncbi:MAG: hypothetical protein LC754_07335 [Acidobacteria bacterium]|nr:hypothetical protein [Acidobacteriota bacterium]